MPKPLTPRLPLNARLPARSYTFTDVWESFRHGLIEIIHPADEQVYEDGRTMLAPGAGPVVVATTGKIPTPGTYEISYYWWVGATGFFANLEFLNAAGAVVRFFQIHSDTINTGPVNGRFQHFLFVGEEIRVRYTGSSSTFNITAYLWWQRVSRTSQVPIGRVLTGGAQISGAISQSSPTISAAPVASSPPASYNPPENVSIGGTE